MGRNASERPCVYAMLRVKTEMEKTRLAREHIGDKADTVATAKSTVPKTSNGALTKKEKKREAVMASTMKTSRKTPSLPTSSSPKASRSLFSLLGTLIVYTLVTGE